MIATIQTQPTEEPITLEDAKQHLRLDIDDDDSLVLPLIKASREYAEVVTHRALITQTWKYYLADWPEKLDYIEIPFPPLQSSSLTVKYIYYDSALSAWTQATWAPTNYIIDTNSEPGRIVLAYGIEWPTATLYPSNPIEINFVCGYGTPDDVPEMIKTGMKIDIADMYENRESIIIGQTVNHLDLVDRLYWPYRVNIL